MVLVNPDYQSVVAFSEEEASEVLVLKVLQEVVKVQLLSLVNPSEAAQGPPAWSGSSGSAMVDTLVPEA